MRSWTRSLPNSLTPDPVRICLMFRSTPLRFILSRTSGTPTYPVVRQSLRPFAASRLRHASTSSTSAPSRSPALPVLLAALTCALLGYTIGSAASLPSPLASLGLGRRQVSTEDDEPTYGTPKDFQKAIQELKHAFDDEGHDSGVVSTDPDDLQIHGFSDNDHHPGASRSSLVVGSHIYFPSNCSTFVAGDHCQLCICRGWTLQLLLIQS